MTGRRLSTILALDVAGYTRMMQADAAGLVKALNAVFRGLVEPAVSRHQGRVIKLLGDGALVEFSSAYNAVNCGAEILTGLRDPGTLYRFQEPIVLRGGIHAGDVIVEGGDTFGTGVNVAARVQAAAAPGGLWLTRMVADLAGADLPFRLRSEGSHNLKNIDRPMELLSVDLTGAEGAAALARITETEQVRFCRSADGVRLAWSSVGTGSPVVKAPNWISNLELDWRNPGAAHLLASIAARHRLVRFDARGNGLSDWDVGNIDFERFVDDLETVFDAAEIERAPILALSQGGAVAAAFAARAPERVSAIVMIGAYPLGRAKRNSPKDKERALALKAMMAAGWEDDYPSLRDLMAEIIVPMASTEDRRQFAEDMRNMISAENMARYRDVLDYIDVTGLLPAIDVPALVLHCKGDRLQPVEQGRDFAAGLPNARFIAYESPNHNLTENDPNWPVAEREIHEFLARHG